MKKLLVLVIVLIGAYFAMAKWTPRALDRIAFWKSKRVEPAAALPTPEPAPQAVTELPGGTPIAPPSAAPAPAPVAASGETVVASPQAAKPAQPAATANAVPVDKAAQVIVVCYHRVEGSGGGALAITPQLFEEHMQKLKDNGITVISMQDFLAWRRSEKNIPAKSAIITIDDGYLSGYEVARPILKKFGYPWTAFVYTKYISSGGKSMTWEQLAEIRDEGVEIGSHTVSHIALNSKGGKTAEQYTAFLQHEIIESKKILEQRLGIKCATFAYPEGKYNAQVLDVVKEAGYEAAFSTFGQRVTHGAPAYRIGRYAWYTPRPKDLDAAFAFSGPVAAGGDVDVSQPATISMITQPMDGDVVSNAQPALKVNLATFGEVDPASVQIRLSGVGIVPAKFDPASKNVEARPPEPLKPGEYTSTVSAKVAGKKIEASWRFTVATDGAAKPGAARQPAAN